MMDVLNWAAEHYILAPVLLYIAVGGAYRFSLALGYCGKAGRP